jgi:hypothetical protein
MHENGHCPIQKIEQFGSTWKVYQLDTYAGAKMISAVARQDLRDPDRAAAIKTGRPAKN